MIVFCLGNPIKLESKIIGTSRYFSSPRRVYNDATMEDAIKAFPKAQFEFYYTFNEVKARANVDRDYARPIFIIRINPASIESTIEQFENSKSIKENKNQNEPKRLISPKGVVEKISVWSSNPSSQFTLWDVSYFDKKRSSYYKIMLSGMFDVCPDMFLITCTRTCETYINSGLFSNRHHKEKAKKLIENLKERFEPFDPNKSIISLSNEATALCTKELSNLSPKQKRGDYATMLSIMINCFQGFYFFQGKGIFKSYIKQLLSKDYLQFTDGPAQLILSYLLEENKVEENEKNSKVKI